MIKDLEVRLAELEAYKARIEAKAIEIVKDVDLSKIKDINQY